ncbi:MAG TPA: hypothetical protein VMY42_14890 [Thermoguttaceae bacterium]|nr:hypothetical protein [Thermoguttaceae bacterium]
MSIISNCPKCQQPVRVPDELDLATEVRCPLCEAEYLLSEAMAEVPPALIPIGQPQAVAPVSESVEVGLIAETPLDEGPMLDIWRTADATPQIDTGAVAEDPSAIDTGPAIDTGEESVDTGAFAGFGEGGSGAAVPTTRPVTARPRTKRKQKSALRQILEIVLGGVAGLLIAVYIGSWCGLGIPKLPLPFLPHTKHWFQSGDESGNGDGKTQQSPEENKSPQAASDPKTPELPPDDTAPLLAGPNTPDPLGPDPFLTPDPLIDPVPPPLTDLLPKPRVLPPDYIGPRDPPLISSAELGAALGEANEAIRGEEAVGEVTADNYALFCRLGYLVTFVDPSGPQVSDRKRAIEGLLEDIGQMPGQQSEIAGLAQGVLDDEARLEEGILLAGTVTAAAIDDAKQLQGAVVELAGLSTKVTVLSKPALSIAEGDSVLILGSIVEDPSENLVGHASAKEVVVWGSLAAVLPTNN